MLADTFVASTQLLTALGPEAAQNAGKSSSSENANAKANAGASIVWLDCRPRAAPGLAFKKSSTPAGGLAVGLTHVFAAQADRAVVHVYSVERQHLEAAVPFPERIGCVALLGVSDAEPALLALGTERGRLLLWELCTGRQVFSAPAHLHAVSCIAVDPGSNFVLTGSADSNVHVWNVTDLLSFSDASSSSSLDLAGRPSRRAPLRTLSNHRGPITSLAMGHGHMRTNIAVSASEDRSGVVWDYGSGIALRTFLFTAVPRCLALDPADRALYVGLDDGSVQLVDFFREEAPLSHRHPIYGSAGSRENRNPAAEEAPPSDRWRVSPAYDSACLCLGVSYDGAFLLSGHRDGKVHSWSVSRGRYRSVLADLARPVTNLHLLAPTALAGTHRRQQQQQTTKILHVVKPRYEAELHGDARDARAAAATSTTIPRLYEFRAHFARSLPIPRASALGSSTVAQMSAFDEALNSPAVPLALLEEGIAAFSASSSSSSGGKFHRGEGEEEDQDQNQEQDEIELLRAQLAHARAAQLVHAERIVVLSTELARRDEEDAKREEAELEAHERWVEAQDRRRARWFAGEDISDSVLTEEEEGDDDDDDGGDGDGDGDEEEGDEEEGDGEDRDEVPETEEEDEGQAEQSIYVSATRRGKGDAGWRTEQRVPDSIGEEDDEDPDQDQDEEMAEAADAGLSDHRKRRRRSRASTASVGSVIRVVPESVDGEDGEDD